MRESGRLYAFNLELVPTRPAFVTLLLFWFDGHWLVIVIANFALMGDAFDFDLMSLTHSRRFPKLVLCFPFIFSLVY